MRRAGQRVLRSTRRRHCSAAPVVEAMDSDSSPPERYSFNPSLRWNLEVEEYFTKAYGAERFARISKSLTHPSCYSCIRVNTLKSTSDAVIKKLVNILDEKRLLSGFSSTESCDQNAADVVGQPMNEGASKETLITKCKYPGLDYVLFLKGSGPHVPLYRDYCGQPLKEVIVSRKCAEAVLRGAEVFVPGVLACSSHVEKGDIVAVSVAVEQPGSDGGWGVGITRGTVLQGSESDPYYHERNGLYIGQGVTLMSRAGIFRASEGIAIQMTNRVYELPSFNNVLEGEIFLQNLPSIIAAHVLDPQQGEHILDMCAAPGGKTTAIAVLMRDKGEIVAIDRSHNKVMEILKLAAEMDLTSICAYRLDALKSVCQNDEIVDVGVKKFDKEASDTVIVDPGLSAFANGDRMIYNTKKCSTDLRSSETDGNSIANQGMYISKADLRKNMRRMKNGPGKNQTIGSKVGTSKGYKPNTFDRVLVDAPCSALGLRPRLFAGEETVESLRNHGRYQRRMFDQAVQLVRPGGVIVYSTCTINPGENEALVRYALDTYKFLSLASQHPRIGGPGLVGRCELFGGKYKEEWLTPTEAELVQRFDPSSSLDTIGFFIAKFNVGQKDILSTSSTTLGVL